MTAALEADGVEVWLGRRATSRILDGVGLTAPAGQIVGLIGETGSGKTTLARAIAGLAPLHAGAVRVDGVPVSGLRGAELRRFRRTGRVQYVFQDPLRSLDPDLTVAESVAEGLAVRGDGRAADRRTAAVAALRLVGLDPALGDRLPGQISGGQRQRVTLARALAVGPRVLLLDEPVSALDAANRNHVLRVLDRLRRERELAIVLITHDLGSLAGVADRIVVLHHGRVVEEGPATQVLLAPEHPYTQRLIASVPSIDGPRPIYARSTT
ncbi:ABC transporter ATP-binding protein [Jiangella anatolica]|uniref:Dipeptide/oligopeptide/nickel ABC transporter ATP-binding protein n=1 Tax=Jiangella anatolica TaxID=2670374 RepID=A0A2W2AWB3_9ACTN|nr:ABC transporter ATP-binding protein [Jiangella anatolica]PZF79505.1 dipeptide/oligopeptide/nickel ABC transporter ATP-binding protein [Jiangella anatolica]